MSKCAPMTLSKSVYVLLLSTMILLTTTATADSDSMQIISSSNLNFTNSMYQILAKQQGNVFFSPLSIQVILALMYIGAGGNTAQQMVVGLHLPANDPIVKEGFQSIMTSLKSDGNIVLSVANKLFVEQTFRMKNEFVEDARNSFLADVDSVDFKYNAEASRELINKWVESKTNDKIKDLLKPGFVGASTSLVLVNAVYFKGDWMTKFDPEDTKKQQFFLTASDTIDVDMMRLKGHFDMTYSEKLDAKVLVLPYVGEKLSMVIFLPNTVDGLARMEAKLSEVDLPNLITELYNTEVIVSLPKFRMEQQINLKPILQKLNMTDMFETDSADFGGIAAIGEDPLFVSGVVHKAFIVVGEEGTEAAAATGAAFETRSYHEPEKFQADHPFVFHIRDNNSGALLFVGRLASF